MSLRGDIRIMSDGTRWRPRIARASGAGSTPFGAFIPYGLCKGLTATAPAFYADRKGVTFEKFVIPNPFGL